MTVRRRLFWSNILMILVPVAATALVGLLCVGFIWFAIVGGAGLDTQDPEDFNRVSLAVAEMIGHSLDQQAAPASLEPLLESNGMAAQVFRAGEFVYFFGEADEGDAALKAAADALGDGALVSRSGRSLYRSDERIGGEAYAVYLLGGNPSENAYAKLKAALVVSLVLIALAILASVLTTNRFLTKFVFRRIAEPLDILTDGVHRIRDGNLDFRIQYERADEFMPVCADFNEMAARLKESVDRTQRQERSRKELLAGISHDIRSPLTSIQAYVEGLLDGVAKTPEAQRRYLSTIKGKAEELDRMVSQLFLFSGMELGNFPDKRVRLRLDEALETAISQKRVEYAAQGLKIETSLTPVSVTADPVQLGRVISNVMENSLKYRDKAAGVLRIDLKRRGAECVLSFDDDGPGVPEEALPRLFEAFYRTDSARRNPQKGSGLGLAIVENIVARAGGSVRAEKSALGGLRIEIYLPCEEETYAEDPDCGG